MVSFFSGQSVRPSSPKPNVSNVGTITDSHRFCDGTELAFDASRSYTCTEYKVGS